MTNPYDEPNEFHFGNKTQNGEHSTLSGEDEDHNEDDDEDGEQDDIVEEETEKIVDNQSTSLPIPMNDSTRNFRSVNSKVSLDGCLVPPAPLLAAKRRNKLLLPRVVHPVKVCSAVMV